jgi:Tfp pilus assembly protein PilF
MQLDQLRFGEDEADELEAGADLEGSRSWTFLSYGGASPKERENLYTIFRQFGFDLVGGNPDELVAQIKRSNISKQLLTSIDLGAIDFFSGQPDRDRLLGLTQRASSDPWLNRARAAVIASDRTALKPLASDGIEEQPPANALFVARVLDAWHEHAPALAAARAVQTRHPDHFWANRFLGVLLFMSNRSTGEEIPYLRAAVALRPSNSLVRGELGSFLFNHKLFDDALREMREAVRLNPRWLRAQLSLADILTSNRQPAEAAQSLRAAVAASPDAVVLRLKLGSILNQGMHRPDEAIAVLETCTSSPDKEEAAKAFTYLGDALWRKGSRNEAEAKFRRALEIHPDFSVAHARLGMLHQSKGEKAAAEAEYRESVRLDPKNPSFRNWLVTFLDKEGRRDEAEEIRKESPRDNAGKP